MMGRVDRICAVCALTFTEAVRQKFFYIVLLIGGGMLLGSGYFQQFDFGTDELKFVIDFSFGTLFFLGTILAITASTQLFYSEIENRTAHTLLAKPVRHFECILGKCLGVQLLLLLFVLLLCGLLTVLLYLRELALPVRDAESLVRYGELWLYGLVQWARFGVLCGACLLIGSIARSYLFTMMVAFLFMLVGQLQYIARDSYAEIAFLPLRWLVQALALLFPNLQVFNIGDQLGHAAAGGLPLGVVFQILVYAGAYTLAYLGLAWWNFKRREL
jgi:ABC-type transport system involved in multi-copper enzyme maturation permease subunit